MSLLKHTCEEIVQALTVQGIDYVTLQTVLQALKGNHESNNILFHCLVELIFVRYHGFKYEEARSTWKQFSYTVADYILFCEQQLQEHGFSLFITDLPIKQAKSLMVLQPKALLLACIHILDQTGCIAAVLDQEYPEDVVVLEMHPPNFQQPNIKVLQQMISEMNNLVIQCTDKLARIGKNQAPLPTQKELQLDFIRRLQITLYQQVESEQRQREKLEGYVQETQSDQLQFLLEQEKGQLEIDVDELQQQKLALDQVNFSLDVYNRWACKELWIE